MIEYFPPGATEFQGGTLLPKAFDAEITHERNGKFDLELKYPLVDDKYKDFKKFTIFYADVPYMGKQAFYLSKIKRRKGYVEVYAKHIFFLLDKNITKDIKSSNVIGNSILERFNNSLQIPHNYTFYSNIAESKMFNAPGYQNAMSVLAEGKHSILGQWGGVLVMDNWDIKLLKRWGRDTEFLVAKRKNINDIEIEEDSEGIVTRLFLTREFENDDEVEVITAIVDSPLINEYPEIYGEAKETSDETVKTQEDLIQHGEDIFRLQRIDLPNESFSIEVTDDVKEYEFTIDDTALIYYEDYDIYKRVMVTSYTYDPMTERYLKINFRDKPKTMLQEISEKISGSIVEDIKPNFDYINAMIRDITGQLRDPAGGVIVTQKDNEGRPIELLIVDNTDLEKAMNVWRWNINGLSHSSNGISGDFNAAITQDGKIVADFIATGILNAALIKAGILESANGKTWINMENGYFNLGDISYSENGFKILINDNPLEDHINKEIVSRIDTVYIGANNRLYDSVNNIPCIFNDNQGSLNFMRSKTNSHYKISSPGGVDVSFAFPNSQFAEPLESMGKVTVSIAVKRETEGTVTIDGKAYQLKANQWKRISITKEFTENTSKNIRVLNSYSKKHTRTLIAGTKLIENIVSDTDILYYKQLQVERGDIPTDHRLTPEELEMIIGINTTEIKQLKDEVSISVKKNELSTEVKQNAESWGLSIDGKLKGQNYNFNIDRFKIGGESGDTVEHDNTKSKYLHSDGSYTQVAYSGFKRYTAHNEFEYNYLIYVGEIKIDVTGELGGGIVYLNVPEEFQGKRFEVFTSLKTFSLPVNYFLRDVLVNGSAIQISNTIMISVALKSLKLDNQLGTITGADGQPKSGWWVNSELLTWTTQGSVTVQYIIIA